MCALLQCNVKKSLVQSMNTILKRKVRNILEFSSMRAFSDLEVSSAANPANQWILLNVYVYTRTHQSQKSEKRERRKREEKKRLHRLKFHFG